MIEHDKFVNLIIDYKQYDKIIDDLENIIKCCVYESPIVESYWRIFEMLIKEYFQEPGFDIIMWWLLEAPESRIWDEDGTQIPMNSVDDLWEYVKEFRK